LQLGDTARAKKFLEAIAQAKPPQPRALIELARLRLTAAGDGGTESQEILSADQLASIVTPLLTAQQHAPALSDSYLLLGAAWLRAPAAPTRGQLALIDEGVKRFPRHTGLIYNGAYLMLRGGLAADAHALVQHGLNVARTEEVKNAFTELQASLPPK
jgi:hypothetical protein